MSDASTPIMSQPITFSVDEGDFLLAYLDAAVRSLGLSSAANAAFLANKIKSAFPKPTEGTGGEAAKEAA